MYIHYIYHTSFHEEKASAWQAVTCIFSD